MLWRLELVETPTADAGGRIVVCDIGEIAAPCEIDDIGLGLKPSQTTTEGLANILVNRRVNKLQQMRWSAAGAHAVAVVREHHLLDNY